MAAIGTTFMNDVWKLIFQAVAIAGLAEDDTSSPLTDLWVSLHTASPGASGTQETNEADYGSYARVAVPRSALGWTPTGSALTNADAIEFPAAASGENVITHFGIGTDETGAGKLMFFGPLASPVTVNVGTEAPSFAAGELDGSGT